MNINFVGSELLLKESFFGLGIMALVAICNVYAFAAVALAYRNRLKTATYRGKHIEILRFSLYTMLLVVGMFLSLTVWVVALSLFEIVSNWEAAVLLTVSFFTSVGNFSQDLPFGWRLIPSLIAFSGLFSFAWATASSIGMAHQLLIYLDKHKDL
jgi:hypothetical protein